MPNPKPGSFVHIELASTDPARTRKFFEEVFEWKFEEMPEMQYATFEPGSPPGGGLMSPMQNMAPGILNYLLSTDVDGDLRRIETAGGRILMPRTEIPNVGWWALFQEPTGLTLALFQSRPMPAQQRPRRRPAARKARAGRRGARRGARRGRRGR